MKKENKKSYLIHKITRLAVLLALGIVLNIVESLIPIPIAIPGIRLGLANTITLIVLYMYTPGDYLLIGFLRVLTVGLLRTGLGSTAFLFSVSGWLLSSIISLIIYSFHKASIFGLSIASSCFHQVGQIIVCILLYSQISFINYLPILLASGIISGVLVAFISYFTLTKLDKILK